MHRFFQYNRGMTVAVIGARIKEEFEPVEMFIQIVSPILGVHTGPGAVAMCGYSE